MIFSQDTPAPKCGLLWNTYLGDIEWFRHSAKSFQKFARGWDFARCLVPRKDEAAFKPICDEFGIEALPGDDWPDRSFNWHQLMHCYADEIFKEADIIFHIDADSVFGQECYPADWFRDGKILLPYTEYRHFLKHPIRLDEMQTFMGLTGKQIDFSRGQLNWKFAVDFALGLESERECMAWMPMIHHRDVYGKTRALITQRFPDQTFDNYVFNARNTHPQSFCEFNTLGAVAHKFFEDRYHWHDLACGTYPFYGKVIQSWSHGGLDRQHDYGKQVPSEEINSPRKLFAHLGL